MKRTVIIRVICTVLAAAAIALAWRALIDIAAICLTAAILAFVLTPLQKLLEKRLSPSLSSGICMTAILLAAAALVVIAIPALVNQIMLYAEILPDMIERLEHWIAQLNARMQQMGLPFREISLDDLTLFSGFFGASDPFFSGIVSSISSAGRFLISPILAFYLLRDRRTLFDVLKKLIPYRQRDAVCRFAKDVGSFFSAYLRSQLLISSITGALTAIGLAIVGADAFLLLGILMGVFNLIPYFGPVIGTVPILIFAFSKGVNTTVWSMVVAVSVQQIESYLIAPKILSGAAGFHPGVVMLLLILGGSLMGVWGMVLIVPMATIVKTAYVSFLNHKLYGKKV